MESEKKRPNFLFFFSDQQHKYSLGCMDNPDIITPNLDKLAANGVLFTNAYSNCPICTAARINFFTGLYSNQTDTMENNLRIPEGIKTLAGTLKGSGYRTAFVGKWHIGSSGNKPVPKELLGDFDEYMGYQCYNSFLNEVCFWDENGNKSQFQRHRTDVTTDIAIEKLESLNLGPFLLTVAYQAPHYPVEPSESYYAMYKDKKILPRPNEVEGIGPYTKTYSPPSPEPEEND